jgi:beta-glucosidase
MGDRVRRRRVRLLASAVCLSLTVVIAAQGSPATAAGSLPWMDASLAPEVRADLLIGAMTLDQKIAQLHGQHGSIPELPECGDGPRHVPGIPELGIPTFRITNGPVGLGGGDCRPADKATALPVALGLAAGFDPSLAYQFGELLGGEARTLGLGELEGPGMNLARVGQGGRNFEYFGEDPYLAGAMAASEIRGIQSKNVIAMAKHYVLNDQETNRRTIQVKVDDRTLHELYLTPFEMSVKDGGVGSIMCSYNRIGTTYACEDPYTLNTVLRGQWGFRGYVQSDFGATHSTAAALNAGEDLEMANGNWFTPALVQAALADGSLTVATIDQALKRRYVQMFKYGIFDRPIVRGTIDAQADGAASRRIAEQTAVLLKNDGALLPLDAVKVRSIALIGQSTFAGAAVAGGGGSSRVLPLYTVTPLQGLQNVLAELGSSATVNQVIVADDNSNLADATAAAAAADITIVMAGVVTNEGTDQPNLSLPNNQDALISAVAEANPRTALVLKDGDPVLMPWIGQVPAVLEAWNPGQEDGNAVARLLFGLSNPSGKLPTSYPKAAADTPTSTTDRFPGLDSDGDGIPEVSYSEGLSMGYRWYQSQRIQPLFPFGYGLSYTTFTISNAVATPTRSDGTKPIKVRFCVQNTGRVTGAEVAQVYLGLPAGTGEPPKRLVAFKKVWLKPGEKRLVHLTIDPAASNHPLSTWDSASQAWTTASGDYRIYVGDSSANTPLTDTITVRMPPRPA